MEKEQGNRTLWIVLGIIVGVLFVCMVSGLIGGAIGYAIGASDDRPCERHEYFEPGPWHDEWTPRMPEIPDMPEMPDLPDMPVIPELPEIPERMQPNMRQFGALIIEVEPGSPADDAGLRPNDTIMAVDGERLPENGSLKEALDDYAPGDFVELLVMRDGEREWVGVELGRSPESRNRPYLGVSYRVIPLGVQPGGRD